MTHNVHYLLYDRKDLNILISHKSDIEIIYPLNADIYEESKKLFSDKIIVKGNINDVSKRKIIEEANLIEIFFSSEVDKLTSISDSTKYNLQFIFKVLNKIIFSYWYAISEAKSWGIIYKNKIIVTSEKEKAINYLLISLYEKSQSIFNTTSFNNYPTFIFKILNSITLSLLKNKRIIWTTNYSEKFKDLLEDAKNIDKNLTFITYFISNQNSYVNFIRGIVQIIKLMFQRNKHYAKLFPIVDDFFSIKNELSFLKKIENNKIKCVSNFIIDFLGNIIIQSEALFKNSEILIKKTHSNIFLGHNMHPLDGSILSNIFKKNNLKSILISHGSHTPQKTVLGRYVSDYLSLGLLYSPFATTVVCQSPLAYEAVKDKQLSFKIVKSPPIMWSKKNLINKKNHLDKFVILHASTCKFMHTRPWAYEDTFEFIENITKLIEVIEKIKDTLLIVRLRSFDELSFDSVKNNLPLSNKCIIKNYNSVAFEEDIINSDLMISYSSTTIEEAIHSGRPVGLFGLSKRYRHIEKKNLWQEKRDVIYDLDHKNLLEQLLYIKSKHYNNILEENELKEYVWDDNVTSKKEFITSNLII